MIKFTAHFISGFFIVLASNHAMAEVIDPEKHIQKNGYHSIKMGDDGETRFYSFTERGAALRIAGLEGKIELLPKHVEVQKMCDFMRGGTKAKLIQQRGIAIDVAVTNYGYSGSTVACVLKYMHENNLGTQLIYSKKGVGGMYMVFVTD
ncbi:hypothetical protein M0M42_00260 [Pseudomonas knackmussii]|uniref:Secreted protein n=1 Tax=Pseudomonas knackmussii TaxID=65741 RepID=A0ABY4KRP6_9PSED|nr:hypothetical protein [Pseudomonas knackmussii]UPQ82886.1 hypothetical protein M0M42_00260 [Pseudomonas knackmussii]